jgi:hypothetical protein
MPPKAPTPAQPQAEDEFYDRMEEPCLTFTVYWNGKQLNKAWLDYVRYFLSSARHLRIRFGEIEIRMEVTAGSKFPLNAFLQDMRLKQVLGVYDLPARGVKISVFELIRTKDGMMEEQL